MNRLLLFILTLGLVGATSLLAQMRGGGQRGGGPQMSGPQHHPDPHHGQMQQQRHQSRTHECEQSCTKAREEARHLERYCESSRFDLTTARQLGRQLAERLHAMEEHHVALRERLSAQERERQQKRLETMEQSQQRWRSAFADVERELGKEEPGRETLRRQARTIEKEVNRYRKEVQRQEEVLAQ